MKRQNEFPGLNNDQLEMIKSGLPTGSSDNDFVYITGETGAGKTGTRNAVFSVLNKPGDIIIELGDPLETR